MSIQGRSVGVTVGSTLGGVGAAPAVYPVFTQPYDVIVQAAVHGACVVAPFVPQPYISQVFVPYALPGATCEVQDASYSAEVEIEEP